MDYIGLAVPWVALGIDKLFGDTGFLCLYEPLVETFKRHGHKSVVYLDRRYRETFEAANDPKKTGVYGAYSQSTRNPHRSIDQPLDDVAANMYLDGLTPTDYVITNKPFVLPHLAAQSLSPLSLAKPVVYVCLNAGKDGVTNPLGKVRRKTEDDWRNQRKFYLWMEAATMLTADYSVWTTEDQRSRALGIARRFLSPVEVLALKKRSMVNGCGMTDLLRPHAKPDAEVARYLQSDKNDDFQVAFIGRVTSNKNIGFILETMRVLFAKHGLKLTIRMDKPGMVPTGFADAKDVLHVMDTESFREFLSREDYAAKRLPSVKCMLYASIAEGYSIIPREALYVGVPVMLPDRPWAVTAVGERYPFLYKNQTELIAHVKRLRDGRISDDEVERFLAARRREQTCEFLSDVSDKLFSVCKSLVDARYEDHQRLSHSRVMDAFEQVTGVGEEFTFEAAARKMRATGVSIGIGAEVTGRQVAMDNLWMFLKRRLRCIDPARGLFERMN